MLTGNKEICFKGDAEFLAINENGDFHAIIELNVCNNGPGNFVQESGNF